MRSLRLIAIVVLGLTLAVSQASALEVRREVVPSPAAHARSVLEKLAAFLGFWDKEGCGIDPWGQCATNTSPEEEGCITDPLGQCVPKALVSKEGCIIDPLGGCVKP